jgi:hypothetical protein
MTYRKPRIRPTHRGCQMCGNQWAKVEGLAWDYPACSPCLSELNAIAAGDKKSERFFAAEVKRKLKEVA